MTSTLLLGAVMPMVAHADENRTGTTNTTATFKANTDVVNPVDPTDPTKPLDPDGTGDGNGAQAGSGLSLIYAPVTLGFSDSEKLSIDTVNDQDYIAADGDGTKGTSTMGNTVKVGLQVSDQRGTSAGWTLNVTASDGTVASGNAGMSTLKGATYKLPVGTATSTGEGTDSGATARNGAVAAGAEISVSGQASTSTDGTLVGAASGTVLSAANTTGSGITSDLMNPNDILLRVPANAAAAKTYTGTLNWTLSDTPAS